VSAPGCIIGLVIIEDQQATPRAKQLNEQRDLVGYLVRWGRTLVGDGADGLVEPLRERRPVLQRTEKHHIKFGQDALGEGDRQAGLAHPADPDNRNHPAAVLHHPVLQRLELARTAIQRGDSNRLTPIDDRVGRFWPWCTCWRRTGRFFSLAVDPLCTCCRRRTLERERAGKPHLIEGGEWMWPILGGLLPERVCFRTLIPGRKGMVLQEDGDQALQHLGLGVGQAGLPILHAAAMHADLLCQRDLRQRDPRP